MIQVFEGWILCKICFYFFAISFFYKKKMFHAYIVLDNEPKSDNFYCLAPANAVTGDAKSEITVLTQCQRKATDPEDKPLVTGKHLYTFIDDKIFSMYTGEEMKFDSPETEEVSKWKLMPNGQIRTMSNYCITATKQGDKFQSEITLEKQVNENDKKNLEKLQKWRIVTKI